MAGLKNVEEKVLTSIEAREIVDLKTVDLQDAEKSLAIALLRDRDFKAQELTITKLEETITKQAGELEKIKKTPNVKNHKIIKDWQHKLHDHLNGHELMNEEDLEDLFKALQKI